MSRSRFENLEIYQLSEKLADFIWNCVLTWDKFAKDTVGEQIVNSSDSIGGNIAEGSGKGSDADFKRYCKIARGSLYETKHWLQRAYNRRLLKPDGVENIKIILDELLPKISAYINYLDNKINNKDDSD